MSALRDMGPGYGRSNRSPAFPLAGIMSPFGLYCMAAAPLFAGETLSAAFMQGRMQTQPVKNPLNGAWAEMWVVSVPLSLISESLINDIAPSTAGFTAGTDRPRFFTKSGAVDWIKLAYDKVVAEYFRRPGALGSQIDGVEMLPRMGVDWTENLMLKPASGDPTKWPQQAITEELTGLDLETERQLIEASDYRRFTQQFGVRDPKPDNRPRIHRYVRSWTLPRSTVDTATGMPRASFGWDLALRMEKGHRMKEHSLVLVLGAWRPLMLNSITPWSFIQRMVGLKHWLPPRADAAWDTIQGNDPVFKAGFGVAGDTLVYDRSDVFARGETFINCASVDSPYPPITSANGLVTDGQDGIRSKFPSVAEINSIFVGANATDRVGYYQAMLQLRVNGLVRQVDVADS